MALKLSVLSSFSADGIESAARYLAPSRHCVELYAFMQTDLRLLSRHIPIVRSHLKSSNEEPTMHSILGRLNDVPENQIRSLAHEISELFGDCRIIGIATYLPEISAPEKKNMVAWQDAQRGLIFIVRLAKALNAIGHNHLRTVELVAGSITAGLFFEHSFPQTLYSFKQKQAQCIDQLITRLEDVATIASDGKVINLAVECEPGPLFVLNDFWAARALCNAAEFGSHAIRRVLGLNIDIPHWAFLGDEKMQKCSTVFNDPMISRRIVHAHISDHSSGHNSDNVPGWCHDIEEFRPWIRQLRQLPITQQGEVRPRFSGFISCEMEACKSELLLSEAIKQCDALI